MGSPGGRDPGRLVGLKCGRRDETRETRDPWSEGREGVCGVR